MTKSQTNRFANRHNFYNLSLIPSYEFPSDDNLPNNDIKLWGDPLESATIIRFPPGVAQILKCRYLANHMNVYNVTSFDNTNLPESLPNIEYNMKDLVDYGLQIIPTMREDFRFFEFQLDIYNSDEVKIINTWHPYIQLSEHYPRMKGDNKSILYTLQLYGLLTELPFQIDLYKTLNKEDLIKANSTGQMLVVYFLEDELITIGQKISKLSNHDCSLLHLRDEELNSDLAIKPKCPWLYLHGLTKPLKHAREERTKTLLPVDKSTMHDTELNILSILKSGREEWVEFNLMNNLECTMYMEAINNNSTVPNSANVLSNDTEFTVNVINDSKVFEDDKSDLSDMLFDDTTPSDIRELMEDRPYALNQKRPKGKKNAVSETGIENELNRRQIENEMSLLDSKEIQVSGLITKKDPYDYFYSNAILDDDD